MDSESKILLPEMQVEEVEYLLSREEEAHRKASARVTATEKRNKTLRNQNDALEGQLRTLEQCWNCPDLGNNRICVKCANNSIFSEINGSYHWNDPRNTRRKEVVP